jgi:hypothetical protein
LTQVSFTSNKAFVTKLKKGVVTSLDMKGLTLEVLKEITKYERQGSLEKLLVQITKSSGDADKITKLSIQLALDKLYEGLVRGYLQCTKGVGHLRQDGAPDPDVNDAVEGLTSTLVHFERLHQQWCLFVGPPPKTGKETGAKAAHRKEINTAVEHLSKVLKEYLSLLVDPIYKLQKAVNDKLIADWKVVLNKKPIARDVIEKHVAPEDKHQVIVDLVAKVGPAVAELSTALVAFFPDLVPKDVSTQVYTCEKANAYLQL